MPNGGIYPTATASHLICLSVRHIRLSSFCPLYTSSQVVDQCLLPRLNDSVIKRQAGYKHELKSAEEAKAEAVLKNWVPRFMETCYECGKESIYF